MAGSQCLLPIRGDVLGVKLQSLCRTPYQVKKDGVGIPLADMNSKNIYCSVYQMPRIQFYGL